jgi:hypothetical protein
MFLDGPVLLGRMSGVFEYDILIVEVPAGLRITALSERVDN